MSLFDSASLVVTPNGVKEDKLYSIKPSDGSGDLVVTRATTATRVNSSGLIEVVPRNLVRYSEQFDNATWTKYQSTITTNVINSPIGTLTADKIIPSAVSDQHYLRVASAPINLISGVSIATYSIYAKQGEYYNFRLGTNATAVIGATFNLSNGTISNNTAISAFIEDVGNGWYRCIVRGLVGSVLDCLIVNNSGVDSFAGNAVNGLYLWGAQIEELSTATEYFPTTDRLNIPRLDYSNGSCPSLLVEPQRTNLVTYSEQLDNAAWTKSGVTVTANTTISPDGTQNADTVTNITTGQSHIRTGFVVASTGNYTGTSYIKKQDFDFIYVEFGNAYAWFNISNGTLGNSGNFGSGWTFVSHSIESVGNDWYRISITANNTITGTYNFRPYQPTSANGSYTSGSTGTSFIWGAQVEQGSYATSYIPTSGSTVTRNADVISKTGISSLIGQTEGTMYAEVDLSIQSEAGLFRRILMISNGTETDSTYLRVTSGNIVQFVSFDGTVQTLINSISSISGNVKIAATYKTNEFKLYINGVLQGTDLLGSIPATRSILRIGNSDALISTHNLNDRIELATLFQTALTDAQCIELTTL